MGLDAYFSVGRTNTWMWPSSKIMKLGKNHILEMSFGLCSGIVTSLVCFIFILQICNVVH